MGLFSCLGGGGGSEPKIMPPSPYFVAPADTLAPQHQSSSEDRALASEREADEAKTQLRVLQAQFKELQQAHSANHTTNSSPANIPTVAPTDPPSDAASLQAWSVQNVKKMELSLKEEQDKTSEAIKQLDESKRALKQLKDEQAAHILSQEQNLAEAQATHSAEVQQLKKEVVEASSSSVAAVADSKLRQSEADLLHQVEVQKALQAEQLQTLTQLGELKQAHAVLGGQLEERDAQKIDQQHKHAGLQEQVDTLEKERAVQDLALAALRVDVGKKEEDHAALQNALVKLKVQLDGKEKALVELQQVHVGINDQVVELQKVQGDIHERMREKAEEHGKQLLSCEGLQVEVAQLREGATERQAAQELYTGLNSGLEELLQANVSLQSEVEEKTQLLAALQLAHFGLQAEVAEAVKDLEVTQKAPKASLEEISKVAVSPTSTRSSASSMPLELRRLQEENVELRSEMDQLQLSAMSREEKLLKWAQEKLDQQDGVQPRELPELGMMWSRSDSHLSVEKRAQQAPKLGIPLDKSLGQDPAAPSTLGAAADAIPLLPPSAGSAAQEMLDVHGANEQLRASITRLEADRDAALEDLAAARKLTEASLAREAKLIATIKDLRKELDSTHEMHEEAMSAMEALHREHAQLRDRFRLLQGEVKGKEEMLDLLQEQMHEMADFDLDKVLAEANVTPIYKTPKDKEARAYAAIGRQAMG